MLRLLQRLYSQDSKLSKMSKIHRSGIQFPDSVAKKKTDPHGNPINIMTLEILNFQYKNNPVFIEAFKFKVDVIEDDIFECERNLQNNVCTVDEIQECQENFFTHLYFMESLTGRLVDEQEEKTVLRIVRYMKSLRRSSILFKRNSQIVDASKYTTQGLLPKSNPVLLGQRTELVYNKQNIHCVAHNDSLKEIDSFHCYC